jgi:hypothetical protein
LTRITAYSCQFGNFPLLVGGFGFPRLRLMASHESVRPKRAQDFYLLYREKLKMPKLTKKQIDEMRQTMQAIARAVCEHVWGKKFY